MLIALDFSDSRRLRAPGLRAVQREISLQVEHVGGSAQTRKNRHEDARVRFIIRFQFWALQYIIPYEYLEYLAQ